MIQLRILSGKQAGATHTITRFPCVLGRSPGVHLRLEEPGVWDKHLQLDLQRGQGITAEALTGASAWVNGEPLASAALRGGDIIDLGGVKMQFWLSPTRQRAFRASDWLIWIGLAALTAFQIFLIYRLLR